MDEATCVCGWQLVALTASTALVTTGYGEIEGRPSQQGRPALRHRLVEAVLIEDRTAARHNADIQARKTT
jgi:hypothetical protein